MSGIFASTANQMLMLMLFLATGYILARKGIMPGNADATLAKLETYLIMPAMIINTFATHCTPAALAQDGKLLLVASVCSLVAIAVSYPLAAAFVKPGALRNVYRYSFAFANISYVGNVVMANVFGSEMLFHYLMFSIPYCFTTYTWGFLMLTSEYGKKFSWKQLLQPIILGLLIGVFLGLTKIRLPAFVSTAIESVAGCLGPVAMLLTGMVISKFHWRELLSGWRVYVASAIRLIVLPAAFTLILRAVGITGTTLACALAAVCMPFGLNTVVFPAAYGGDERPGASMVVVSHVLSVITIPIMFALFLG